VTFQGAIFYTQLNDSKPIDFILRSPAIATEAPPSIRAAYLAGSAAFAEDYHDSDLGKPHDPERRSTWLEMLGEVGAYDLAQHDPWASGPGGWDLLLKTSIGIAAVVSFSSEEVPV